MTTEKPTVVLNRPQGTNEWKMSLNGGVSHGAGHYPTVHVGLQNDGDFTYTITPASGTTFSNDPIWIQKGLTKPPSAGVDSQITNITGQGTTVLKFHDSNQDAGQLTYVLNFSDGTKLDPIIDNGGHPMIGPRPSNSITLDYATFAIVLLIVLIIGGVAGWLIGRR